jgi:hypothetical protein
LKKRRETSRKNLSKPNIEYQSVNSHENTKFDALEVAPEDESYFLFDEAALRVEDSDGNSI